MEFELTSLKRSDDKKHQSGNQMMMSRSSTIQNTLDNNSMDKLRMILIRMYLFFLKLENTNLIHIYH